MSDSEVVKLADKKYGYKCKAIASVAICALGGFVMWLTNGETGVGWAVFGLAIIWGS